jgi:transposase
MSLSVASLALNPDELRRLADWLVAQNVQEVVMESTAQYWRPVWNTLERYGSAQCRGAEGAGPMSGSLLLALAQSNRGPGGRKRDFVDAERLLKRLVAQELVLSFVPDAEQRMWRTVVRRKYQLTRDRVRLQNQLESLLEEAQVKLSSLVSDLFGLSARRMLRALADGEQIQQPSPRLEIAGSMPARSSCVMRLGLPQTSRALMAPA